MESKLLGPAISSMFFLLLSHSHAFSHFLLFYPPLLPLQPFLSFAGFWSLPCSVSPVSTVVLASSVPGPVFHFLLTVLHCLLGSVTNCLCFLPALLVRLTCPYTCCSFTSCLSCSSCWQASVSSPWVCSSVSNKAFFSLSFSSRTCTEREKTGLIFTEKNAHRLQRLGRLIGSHILKATCCWFPRSLDGTDS